MKNIFTIIISALCILSSTIVLAEETIEKNATPPIVVSNEILNCGEVASSIKKEIGELGECWEDTDCLIVSFGCPWQEGPCHHSIAGKDEQDKFDNINKKIFSFNKGCIPKNKQLQEYCGRYKKISASVKCHPQKLSCLNGRCVTETELILQSIGTRPGSYGYKKKSKNEKQEIGK